VATSSDYEVDEAVRSLQAAVPHPRVTDLVFHDDRDLTAEQVVDEVLAYRATPLQQRLCAVMLIRFAPLTPA
jgi:hypothetical protein